MPIPTDRKRYTLIKFALEMTACKYIHVYVYLATHVQKGIVIQSYVFCKLNLRVLGTNSLFMSLPVAMDSILKTRAARRTQFVAV